MRGLELGLQLRWAAGAFPEREGLGKQDASGVMGPITTLVS